MSLVDGDKATAVAILAVVDSLLRQAEKLVPEHSEAYYSIGEALTNVSDAEYKIQDYI